MDATVPVYPATTDRCPPPELIPLTTHADDRGDLTEILHNYELANGKFGQVYVVRNPMPGAIRAFHKHTKLWDYFSVIRGKAIFWLVARKSSCERPEDSVCKAIRWPTNDGLRTAWAKRYVLSDAPMSLLVVPPEVYHGWMSVTDNTILLSTGSECYNRENPDERRVSHDVFADLGVKWEVMAR